MAGTTTTSLTETIPSEQINGLIIPEPQAPSVWEAISHVVPNAQGHLYRWTSEDAGDTVAVKAQNASFQNTEYTTGKSEASPATVGDSTDYSDEILVSGSKASMPQMVARIARRVGTKINKDILALAPSCTNHSDYSGLALDTDKFIDAVTLFGAQNPTNPRICFVGSAGMIAALTKAVVNLGGAAAVGNFGEGLVQASKTQGFVTQFMGTELYRSDVFVDGANAVGMFVSAADFGSMIDGEWQPGSGVGAAFWWQPRAAQERVERDTKTVLTVSARYGVAITSQINVRKLTALK
jgi:hypothetical protein